MDVSTKRKLLSAKNRREFSQIMHEAGLRYIEELDEETLQLFDSFLSKIKTSPDEEDETGNPFSDPIIKIIK